MAVSKVSPEALCLSDLPSTQTTMSWLPQQGSSQLGLWQIENNKKIVFGFESTMVILIC